jgi:hypothetical protein
VGASRKFKFIPSTVNPVNHYFPTAGTVDVLRFDAEQGDLSLTSKVLELEYTCPNDGNHLYMPEFGYVSPQSGLPGMRSRYQGNTQTTKDKLRTDITGVTDFDLTAGQSVVITYQLSHESTAKGNNSSIRILDLASATGGAPGIMVEQTNATWYIYVFDDSATQHVTAWNSGGILWRDDQVVTVRWVLSRASSKATLSYKIFGEPTVTIADGDTALLGTAFSSLGAVTFSASTSKKFAVGSGSEDNQTDTSYLGTYYQWAFAKGVDYNPLTLAP